MYMGVCGRSEVVRAYKIRRSPVPHVRRYLSPSTKYTETAHMHDVSGKLDVPNIKERSSKGCGCLIRHRKHRDFGIDSADSFRGQQHFLPTKVPFEPRPEAKVL